VITLSIMIVATAGLVSYGMYWRRDTVHRWRRTIKDLAGRCGLRPHLRDEWAWMEGTIRGVPVRVEAVHDPEHPGVDRWTLISANPPIPTHISFTLRLADHEPPPIGHPDFDAHVAASEHAEARVLLDSTTRLLIADVIAAKGRIQEGRISFKFMDAISAKRIEPLLWLVGTLGERMMTPDDDKLAQLAGNHDLSQADAALALLGQDPRRVSIARDILKTRKGRWVLMAARHLGGEALTAVRRLVLSAETPENLRLAGLDWIADHDREQAAQTALQSLQTEALALRALALHAGGPPPPLDALGAIAADWPKPGLKALQLARQHGAAAVPMLRAHLRGAVPELARAAAAGLGFVGDVGVVPELVDVRDNGPRSVRAAAQAAIDAIQGRARIDAGGLAVVETGGLSDAEEG
jgi:hypothetical protein